jgi:hypothetical protein
VKTESSLTRVNDSGFEGAPIHGLNQTKIEPIDRKTIKREFDSLLRCTDSIELFLHQRSPSETNKDVKKDRLKYFSMLQEIQIAFQACEERKYELLTTVVPDLASANSTLPLWDKNGIKITRPTLLHIACFSGSYKCVEFLLKSGGDVEHLDVFFHFFGENVFFSSFPNSSLHCVNGGLHTNRFTTS